MPVRFGVHTGQQDLALDDLRALWRDLDAAGLDRISIWDHFYEAPPVDGLIPYFEAIASLATLAADTRRRPHRPVPPGRRPGHQHRPPRPLAGEACPERAAGERPRRSP